MNYQEIINELEKIESKNKDINNVVLELFSLISVLINDTDLSIKVLKSKLK